MFSVALKDPLEHFSEFQKIAEIAPFKDVPEA